MSEVNQLTEAIIGAAIEVHKRLGRDGFDGTSGFQFCQNLGYVVYR